MASRRIRIETRIVCIFSRFTQHEIIGSKHMHNNDEEEKEKKEEEEEQDEERQREKEIFFLVLLKY